MINFKWKFIYWLSSPRLTAGLLLYSVIFIFLATIQIPALGISQVQAKFFEAWFCNPLGGFLYVPGGMLVGVLALLNLAFSSFRFCARGVDGIGFATVHIALMLLIVSGFLQGIWRVEGAIELRQGEANSTIYLSEGAGAEPKAITLPFSVELVKFTEQKWDNSNLARQYSSLVKFRYEDIVIEKLIKMNEPASFGSWTFYQSSFRGENVSVLQAVRNPASLLPLVSVALIFGGMIIVYALKLKRARR